MAIPLFVLAVGLAMLVVEYAIQARRWPSVEGWWLRAIAANLVQVAMAVIAGTAWDGWMIRHQPWSAADLSIPIQAGLGYFAITFVYYWWHRR